MILYKDSQMSRHNNIPALLFSATKVKWNVIIEALTRPTSNKNISCNVYSFIDFHNKVHQMVHLARQIKFPIALKPFRFLFSHSLLSLMNDQAKLSKDVCVYKCHCEAAANCLISYEEENHRQCCYSDNWPGMISLLTVTKW